MRRPSKSNAAEPEPRISIEATLVLEPAAGESRLRRPSCAGVQLLRERCKMKTVGFFALALTAQLVVDHGAGAHAHSLTAGKPLETPAFTAHLDKAAGGALDEYTLTVTYRQPANVRRETLEIELPAPSGARTIFRDGRLRELNGAPLHMDAFGPKYIEAMSENASTVLVATGGLEGFAAQQLPGGRVRVSLELDDTANHPFRAESKCVRNWRHPPKMADHSTRQRSSGEIATYRFFLGQTAAHPTPLVMQRFSSGARAALALTDH